MAALRAHVPTHFNRHSRADSPANIPYTRGVKHASPHRVRHPPLPRPPLKVLAVGDLEHPEFARPLDRLERDGQFTTASLEEINSAARFDLLLACQATPGSIPHAPLAEASRRHPLAGLVVLLGSWCEGEARTGRPLPEFRRLFWYQFPLWWQSTREAWKRGEPTDWQLPPGFVPPTRQSAVRGLVTIAANDHATATTLIDGCHHLGWQALWCPRGSSWPVTSPPAAGIWVGGMLDPPEEPSLREFRAWLPPGVPLLVLLDFPRLDRVQVATRLGATAVLGKPWRLDQLALALTHQKA